MQEAAAPAALAPSSTAPFDDGKGERDWVHVETFTLPQPIERVWAVMADTQHVNEVFFGLGALRVTSRDADKAHIRGGFGFFAPEYDEYPWVFEVPTRYRSLRVFTKGVLERVETDCRLSKNDDDSTTVTYTLRLRTMRGPIGWIAGSVFLRRLRGGLSRARSFLESLGDGAIVWPPQNPQREAVLQRAEAVAARVPVANDDEKRALAALLIAVAEDPEADVARLRPYARADQWRLSRDATLTVFLHATRAGLLRLSWDLLCPACDGASTVTSLKDIPKGGHCPACDIDFTVGFEQNVEATFQPEPAIRPSDRVVFCHGSPSSTQSWLAQVFVPPGAAQELAVNLSPGRYRLQASGIQSPALFEVSADGPAAHDVVVGEGADGLEGPKTLKAHGAALRLHNRGSKTRRVQVAHRQLASQAATAADVTATGVFRELFGEQVLSPDQHVAIGQRTILFTDLVGSTALYERTGDGVAYGLVREHFKLLFAAIEAHHGRVVKTVGDAVMAAFDVPVDGARAGLDCVLALRRLRDAQGQAPGLRLRVGVHAGPAIAVEQNGIIDYFGRTVNVAARVESLGNADELVLSQSVLDATGVAELLEQFARDGHAVSRERCAVKGVPVPIDIARVAVAASDAPK